MKISKFLVITLGWGLGLTPAISAMAFDRPFAIANPVIPAAATGSESLSSTPEVETETASGETSLPVTPPQTAVTPADLPVVSTQATDLGEAFLTEATEDGAVSLTAQADPLMGDNLRFSPLERPLTQLFGFETATPLEAKDLVLFTGGTSFNNPDDFRGDDNRGNDLRFGAAYGITDDLEVNVGVFGKDDTIFSNLVRDNSNLQLIYGGAPVQFKWRFYDQERLSSALVVGAEFPLQTVPESTVSRRLGGINPRQILFGERGTRLLEDNTLKAVDHTPYFSVALPLSYQLSSKARLHLNPQVSIFPESIEVTAIQGDRAVLEAANIGLEGNRLDYYGAVAGIGFGVDYSLTQRLYFAADVTPVVAGQNSVGSGGENSLFVTRPVWNIGLRYAPNSRLGVNLYATNRFGPIAAAPSNLLAQPDGNWGVGVDFIYLPDVAGSYDIDIRDTYPTASAFLSLPNSFPSATLPINSILYQLSAGSSGRVAPTVRVGLLDDLELAAGFNLGSTEELEYEGFFLGRLALIRDRGQEGLAAALGFGATLFESSINSTEFGLYAELPLQYRLSAANSVFHVVPKVAIPVAALGVDPIFGISLGTTWNIARNTQLLAQVTPMITGDNQLQDAPVPGQLIPLQGRNLLYSAGVRQLFPNGNSLYALDLYVGNSVADYGLQGISALPDGGVQVGLRFSILNGVPGT